MYSRSSLRPLTQFPHPFVRSLHFFQWHVGHILLQRNSQSKIHSQLVLIGVAQFDGNHLAQSRAHIGDSQRTVECQPPRPLHGAAAKAASGDDFIVPRFQRDMERLLIRFKTRSGNRQTRR